MSPETARALLDRQLAFKGRSVTLRRFTGPSTAPLSTWTDLEVPAKAIAANAAELVAGINMTGRRLILSPTNTEAANWPAPALNKDAVIIDGVKRIIESWVPVSMGDKVVRIEVQVKG